MSRHYFYLFFINVVNNILLFVPYFLIMDRFNGAPLAILISLPSAMLLFTLFSLGMSKFPNKNIHEILKPFLPVWLNNSLMFAFSVQWFAAGMITLLGVNMIIRQFVLPDSLNFEVSFMLFFFIILAATMSSEKVLTIIKVLIILMTPLIFTIVFKAIFNPAISWPSIKEAATHITDIPGLLPVSASIYVYSGYSNMVIFNKYYSSSIKFYGPMIVGGIGFLTLTTVFFLPIGFQGTDGIGDFAYPWLATADSMLMRFGVVDRVFYVYLLLYSMIALASLTVHWHVALELIKTAVKRKYTSHSTLTLFVTVSFILLILLNKHALEKLSIYWMINRQIFEIAMVLSIFILSKFRRGSS